MGSCERKINKNGLFDPNSITIIDILKSLNYTFKRVDEISNLANKHENTVRNCLRNLYLAGIISRENKKGTEGKKYGAMKYSLNRPQMWGDFRR